MIKRELRIPTRLVLTEGDVTNTDYLLKSHTLQCAVAAPTPDMTRIHGRAAIVVDFGVEVKAGLRIVCREAFSGPRDGKRELQTAIRIRFGESVGECCAELYERGACNDHSPRDFRTTLSHMSCTAWGQSGFRFARVDFLDETCDVILIGLVADGEVLDLPTVYEYKGNDALTGAIYTAAKRTIDLCAAGEFVWDGIKRDRLVWIGDMHPEMLALTALYGRTEVMENSIRYLAETTPDDAWMCTIVTYSAWWVIVLSDYFARTDCRDFAEPLLPYAEKTLRKFLPYVTEDGTLLFRDRSLVDWPTHEQPDEPAGMRAILLYMANRADALFAAFGHPAAAIARDLAARLKKQPIVVTHAMQVAGLKYMALGELPEEDVALMKKLGANGMSTFMSYYILTAYAHYFGTDAAMAIMKEYYGGMLSRGATTFWEDFHLDWLEGSGRIDEPTPAGLRDLHGDYGAFCYVGFRHSFCHAWSTGILAFMKENNI